jgi:cytochrome c oxidase subunit IV
MALLEETSRIQAAPAERAKIIKLWKIAGFLLLVTLVEFAFAFGLPDHWKVMKISIFVGLTFVKAFYIIAEFMHLRHETKVLVWSIALPMIFVVWFLLALIYEGGSILGVR